MMLQQEEAILKNTLAVNTIGIRRKIETTKEAINTSTVKDIVEKEVARTHLLNKIKTENGVTTQSATVVNIALRTTKRSITSIGGTTRTQMSVRCVRDLDHPLQLLLLKTKITKILIKRPKVQLMVTVKQLKVRASTIKMLLILITK